MLAATYRLRIGSRIRQLALLTAIGAVLHSSDRMGVPLASWNRDHLCPAGSHDSAHAQMHRTSAHSHQVLIETAEHIEP
jgi:hypothetical protein